jgi:hypothetical protein
MKGDRVEIVVDIGEGTKTYQIAATKAGRRVEVSNVRGTIEVSEVTRNGEVVRTGRFMATRVVALIEHNEAAARGARLRHHCARRRLSRHGDGKRAGQNNQCDKPDGHRIEPAREAPGNAQHDADGH